MVKDKEEAKMSYFRMSIPPQDEYTKKWLKAQYNGSFSIRKLIYDDIAKHGFQDAHSRLPEIIVQEEIDDSI